MISIIYWSTVDETEACHLASHAQLVSL